MRNRVKILGFILGIVVFFAVSKVFASKGVVFIPEKELPRHIGIIGPIAMGSKKIELSAFALVRNVVKNYMSGKGYVVTYLDWDIPKGKKINFSLIRGAYKKNPELEGILLIKVYQLSSFNMAFAQYYKMDGELCLFSKQKKLGCWRETATRKKLSIATDPLGAIATVVSSVVSSSGNVNIKNIIFEWAFKVSSLIPSFSSAAKKPKIIRVVTNITPHTFKIGDKILVGMEGTAGGKASFDLSPMVKHIPMSEVQNGIYKGMYVVKEGDRLHNGVLYLHLENESGERRDWVETNPLISIDGIPPQKPQSFKASASKSHILLKWNTSDTSVKRFILFRSENPLSGYKKIAQVEGFSYIDKTVSPGKRYFYRLAAEDAVGNLSPSVQVGPVSLPMLGTRPLPQVIVNNIPAGKYSLNGTVSIPLGVNVIIGPNVEITFMRNATLKIEGNVEMRSVFINSKSNGTAIEVTPTGTLTMRGIQMEGIEKGIRVRGKLEANNFSITHEREGVVIKTLQSVVLTNGTLQSLSRAVDIEEGRVKIRGCSFDGNRVGISLKKGQCEVVYNNFTNNGINIEAKVPLKLRENFMGSTSICEFKIKGKVEVVSFLDSPYPGGKTITLEALKEEAKKDKKEAIRYLNKGNYGKSVELFKKVVAINPDAESYIYYIYALSMIGDKSIEKVIERALDKYPYEIKIYQLGIRYYLQTNQEDKAKKLLEKGLRLNPNNPSLMSMSAYFADVSDKNKEKK